MKSVDELADIYRNGLINDIVPFWVKHSVDRQYGGFLTALNRDGTVVDTDKGVWQQGRATWLFGELYNRFEKQDQWLELALHGAKFLDAYCFDPSDGRMWFHLTHDGIPIRKRRYAFSESFAAIAYGELALATGNQDFAKKAESAFKAFTKRDSHDSPKFTDHRPTIHLAEPMITIITAQELRDSIGLADANHWIDRSISTIRDKHMNREFQCVLESVSPDGEFMDHFDSRIINPGHSIEGAWFIIKEGIYRNDHSLIEIGSRMLDWSWQHGWDSEHGGILYFVDAKGLPVQEYWHDMKFWWPQCESIVANLMAWKATGNEKYRSWHEDIHEWTYKHFPDSEHGEWFGYIHRDGRISSRLKGNLWKGPFHIPRMMLESFLLLSNGND